MSRLPYGLAFNGIEIIPEPHEAKVIGFIYDAYLSETPLAGIVDLLHQENIPSPSGNERWSTAVLNRLLRMGKGSVAAAIDDRYKTMAITMGF